MEDRHAVVQSLQPLAASGAPLPADGVPRCLAAIYDGHNGTRAADTAASRLHMLLAADAALRSHTGRRVDEGDGVKAGAGEGGGVKAGAGGGCRYQPELYQAGLSWRSTGRGDRGAGVTGGGGLGGLGSVAGWACLLLGTVGCQ